MNSQLTSAEQLHERLSEVTVLDVRYRTDLPSGREEFLQGHVPGAAYVDLESELAGMPGAGGRHPLPEPGLFLAAMRRAGVRGDRAVVAYDDWSGRAAARAWWLLRHYGHQNVQVLDGGLPAWIAAGGALEEGETFVAPGDFDGQPGAMPVVEAEAVG